MSSKHYTIISFLIFLCSSALLFSQAKKPEFRTMNLHDFMEDYMETAEHDYKKGKKEYLITLLKLTPDLAPEKDKKVWKEIVDKHLESGDLLKSCKACHSKFKKSYKKTYRKKLLQIPTEALREN